MRDNPVEVSLHGTPITVNEPEVPPIPPRRRASNGIWAFCGMLLIAVALAFNGWAVMQQRLVVQGAAPPAGPVTSEVREMWEDREMAAFHQMYQRLMEEFIEEVDSSQLLQGAMEGMVGALGDPRSHYFNPAQMLRQMEQNQGHYTGIGSQVQSRDGLVTLVFVYPDSPAERAGLQNGDQLLEIDGVDARGMSLDEAVSLVRGPRGTVVRLRIQRATEAEPLDFEIVRDTIVSITVRAHMVEEGIGYIQISSFNNATGNQFASELEQLLEAGMRGLILDLRNNGGGTLDGLMPVANLLVPEGEVFSWVFRTRETEVLVSTLEERDFEVVVLINNYSASASEVLAGALQDSGAGLLIGVRSFGKGSAQFTYQLPNRGGVTFTVSRWVTPAGRTIEGNGLEPDIRVIDPAAPLVIDRDLPLRQGQLELLQAKLQALGFAAPFEEEWYGEVLRLPGSTVEAIRAFQSEHGIFVSGSLSDDTLQVLNRLTIELTADEDPQLDVALDEIRRMIGE